MTTEPTNTVARHGTIERVDAPDDARHVRRRRCGWRLVRHLVLSFHGPGGRSQHNRSLSAARSPYKVGLSLSSPDVPQRWKHLLALVRDCDRRHRPTARFHLVQRRQRLHTEPPTHTHHSIVSTSIPPPYRSLYCRTHAAPIAYLFEQRGHKVAATVHERLDARGHFREQLGRDLGERGTVVRRTHSQANPVDGRPQAPTPHTLSTRTWKSLPAHTMSSSLSIKSSGTCRKSTLTPLVS